MRARPLTMSALLAPALALAAGCSRGEAPAEPVAEVPKAAEKEPEPPAEKAPPADAEAAFRARAEAATGTLKKELMAALQAAMKQGPAEAVAACNTKAPAIAEAASSAGLRVGRVATRLRNPANAAKGWQAEQLAAYAQIPAGEAKPRVVDLGDGHFGYVEPLYVNGLCLTCHGPEAQIPDEVEAKLAALYPEDAATGYAAGEFRGLVWATNAP